MATKNIKAKPAQNKQQMAYEHIKAGIEEGIFAPRQRLVIDTLARELSVSQVPVREAIRRLEAEGLVEFSANSGAIVASADPGLWLQIMELLALLEGYTTATAASFVTPEDIQKLRRINAGMRDALSRLDFAGWSSGNLDFHAVISARCTNLAMVEQMAALRARAASIGRFIFPHSEAAILHTLGPDSGQAALDAHEWLITAIERHEAPQVIEFHAREHILEVAIQTKLLLESRLKDTMRRRNTTTRR